MSRTGAERSMSIEPQNRIIMNIGRQRIGFDISCQATVLNPEPTPVAAQVNQPGGKGRKAPKP